MQDIIPKGLGFRNYFNAPVFVFPKGLGFWLLRYPVRNPDKAVTDIHCKEVQGIAL